MNAIGRGIGRFARYVGRELRESQRQQEAADRMKILYGLPITGNAMQPQQMGYQDPLAGQTTVQR
jgi:hypothetical protein